jgi:NAD(P)-dependent dehydrogenase (short-subunit alcohol dehydrogenase family)
MSAQNGPALVTGANSGIGLQLTLRLLKEGWEVIALIRSDFPPGLPDIQDALADKRLRVYQADLSRPESLRAALAEVIRAERHIEILFNNAGVAPRQLDVGPRGYDLAFEVNTLAPYIVTRTLLPLIEAGTKKTIVQTTSGAANLVKIFNQDVLLHPTELKIFSGPYGRSKLALSLWTQAWAEDLNARGIRIVSVDPGPNHTAMNNPRGKSATPFLIRLIQRFINRAPEVGAAHLYRAAMDTSTGATGAYISGDRQRKLVFANKSRDVLSLVSSLSN